jgi:hypothetical protein
LGKKKEEEEVGIDEEPGKSRREVETEGGADF